MTKFQAVIAGVIGIVVILPIALLMSWWAWAQFVQSPRFAAAYFEDVLHYESVAESRRWHWGNHPWGGSSFGCSYAIVNIPVNASLIPPVKWEGDWVETPVVVQDGRHDILGECTYLWPKKLVARLTDAYDQPGSFYTADSETLLLYAPKQGIAARIRFGD